MENVRPKRWAMLPLVFACATVGLMVAEEAAAQSNSSSSWWPFGQSNSSGSQNSGQSATPPSIPADDPVSLKSKHEAGAEVYVAVARLYVESGKFAEAEEQLKIARDKFHDDVRVLLCYAMLKDVINQPEEALKLYREAVKTHPKEPAVYNNLAVHYVQRGMIVEALEAARRAVDLRPREARYRNNLAALLVETGSTQDAFKQLRAGLRGTCCTLRPGFPAVQARSEGGGPAGIHDCPHAQSWDDLGPAVGRAAIPGAWRGQSRHGRHDAAAR